MPAGTADAAVEQFLRYLAVERVASAHTLRSYRTDLADCAAFLASRRLGTLVDADARTLRAYLAALHERGLARTSIARRLAALRSFFRFLMRRGRARANPAREVATPKLPKTLPAYLPIDESEALLRVAPPPAAANPRDRAILELLYGSGLRVSELTGLDVDDVDLEAGSVRVLGKGGKEREVPVGRYGREAIEAYLVASRPAFATGRGRGALFLNQRGGRLSRQSCDRLVRAAARTAGIDRDVSCHTLRHSFATHLLEGGADVRVVQELLGHASVATTQIYTLITREHLREVYEASHPRARRPPPAAGARSSVTAADDEEGDDG